MPIVVPKPTQPSKNSGNVAPTTTSSTHSNSNNASIPLMILTPLSIDTNHTSTPRVMPPPPELLIIQPSPQLPLGEQLNPHQQMQQPISPSIMCPPIIEVDADSEMYFPVVLEEHANNAAAAAGGNSSVSSTQDQYFGFQGFDTVIPLITELGFKDKDKDKEEKESNS
jgi:hypothetical protein